MTNSQLPTFAKPPVVEVIVGVQFSALPNYSNALAGWYWKEFLDSAWSTANEAPRLEDVVESFEESTRWLQKPPFIVSSGMISERLLISNPSTGRLIQVQNSRFILNWRLTESDPTYPRYEVLSEEFIKQLENFKRFVVATGNPPLEINQWEVTYLNHVPKGELWNSAADWPNIFSYLQVPSGGVDGQVLDTFRGEWALALRNQDGRLYVSLQHARINAPPFQEVVALQLTARGSPKSSDLEIELEKGHRAIVLSFAEMTSAKAQDAWERIQ